MKKMEGIRLGFDIGGTKIAVAVRDRSGTEIRKEPVPGQGRPTEVIERLLAICEEIGGMEGPEGAAVSIGGPLDHRRGVVINFPHLPGWRDIPLADILSDRLGLSVTIDNDANFAALAEYRHALRSGDLDRSLPFLYMTLSTGIGGGIVVDGKVLHGLRTSAGELGHVTVAPNGPRCLCGNRGCLEQMASGTNIAAEGRRRVKSDPVRGKWLHERVEGNLARIRTEDVVAGYRADDPLSTEIWLDAIRYLAIGLGSIVHVLAPGRVVLGGGVSLAGDDLLGPLMAGLREHVFYVPLEQITITTAALGHDSSILGTLEAMPSD